MKTLDEVRCRFDGPQGYYDALVAASAEGRLPAHDPATDACAYLTSDGRQCGIGLLFSPEDAAIVQEGRGGTVSLHRSWWKERLPGWLSYDDAKRIQNFHDAVDVSAWCHRRWVGFLNQLPCFAGVVKTNPG